MELPVNENTPLTVIHDSQQYDHEQIYLRFSPARKKSILAMVSVIGLMPLFISSFFTPLIPQVSKDLNAPAGQVSLAVSIAIFGTAIGAMFGSSYSTFYGRRIIFLLGLPLFMTASFRVAASRTIPELLFWRFFQATGASPGLTIGAAVVGDIYKLEERGRALGLFFGAILLGPTLAPIAGGLVAYYSSWRIMQQLLGVIAFVIFLYMLCFFPETYHPGERGVDKIEAGTHPKWRPVILNPFGPIWMLRSPNLLFVSLTGFACIMSEYVILVPLAFTIGTRYGITNEALFGACFIPAGIGNLAGAVYVGRLSDKLVIKWKAKRQGEWYPEDRLRAAVPFTLYCAPLSIMLSGIAVTYISGPLGLWLNFFAFFVNGFGVDGALGPCGTYFIDSMHTRSAEAMAANTGFRQIITALSVSAIIPMIETYGVLFTDTVSALVALIGAVLLWITIRYGSQLRSVVDVGFSDSSNN